MLNQHPDRLETHPKAQRELELFAQYRRRFREDPPLYSLGPDPIAQLEQALKTGRPILENLPDGADQ